MYYYCGSYVASPALGSAGTLIIKISYGISLPGLVVSTIVVLHVSDKSSFLVSVSCSDSFQFPSKYVFVRILRGSRHLTNNSFIHWGTWLGCTCAITVSSYLIASGIPIFSDLVSLIGALLGAAMPFQPMGCMWLYDNWTRGRERKTNCEMGTLVVLEHPGYCFRDFFDGRWDLRIYLQYYSFWQSIIRGFCMVVC